MAELFKKGFVTHPVALAAISFLVGVILTYLVARGTIPLAIPIC